jgi:ElaB/YqjD/DUF883 family membrane-anchored ribosome-binding protein
MELSLPLTAYPSNSDPQRMPMSKSSASQEISSVAAAALDKGREAAHAMREVSDNFVDALDESIKTRPYATLALIAAAGFIFGAAWRRR